MIDVNWLYWLFAHLFINEGDIIRLYCFSICGISVLCEVIVIICLIVVYYGIINKDTSGLIRLYEVFSICDDCMIDWTSEFILLVMNIFW